MNKKRMNKKGALTDIFLYIIIIIVMVLFSGIMVYVTGETKEQFQENGLIDSQTINETFGQVDSSFDSLRWITYFLIIGMALAIFVNNFLVQTHPAFFWIYVLLIIIAVVVAVPVSNSYEELYNNEDIGATFHEFRGTSWLMFNLPTLIAVVGMLGALFLYSRLLRSQGGFI